MNASKATDEWIATRLNGYTEKYYAYLITVFKRLQ